MPFAGKQVNDLARLTSWNPQKGLEIRPSWHCLTGKNQKNGGIVAASIDSPSFGLGELAFVA